MMGTHVRIATVDGPQHVVTGYTVHRDNDRYDARFVDGAGTRCLVSITPAEYDRLAALLTGEYPKCERCKGAGVVPAGNDSADPCPWCDGSCIHCEDAGCPACDPPDPRAPGQVAYEAYNSDAPAGYSASVNKARWDRCAAAVLEHERGR